MSYLGDRREKKSTYQLLGNCWKVAKRTKSEEISIPLCVCWSGESVLGQLWAELCCGSPGVQSALFLPPAGSLPCPFLLPFFSSSFILSFYCIFAFYEKKNALHFSHFIWWKPEISKIWAKSHLQRNRKSSENSWFPFPEGTQKQSGHSPEGCAQEILFQQQEQLQKGMFCDSTQKMNRKIKQLDEC